MSCVAAMDSTSRHEGACDDFIPWCLQCAGLEREGS